MFDALVEIASFFGVIGLIVFFESRKRGPCQHLRTRCIHGDEITARTIVYTFRFWRPSLVRRQICLECGAALDRVAICTGTGEDLHEWEGPWPYTD